MAEASRVSTVARVSAVAKGQRPAFGQAEARRVRVSCAGFVRVRVDGGLLLVRSRSLWAHKRQWVWTAIGGAYRYDDRARTLLEDLGAADFEQGGGELRMSLPDSSIDRFDRWFQEAALREHTPLREAVEELVDEEGALPDADGLRLGGRYRFVRERRVAPLSGRMTVYFHEWFDASPDRATANALVRASAVAGGTLAVVSPAEIAEGRRAADGYAIADFTHQLL
jgi:hypothetical protein